MIFKTKGLLRTKLYFLKLDELVKKIPRKVCSMSNSQKKHQHPTLNTTPTRKKNTDTVNNDFLGPSEISSIPYFLIHPPFSSIHKMWI